MTPSLSELLRAVIDSSAESVLFFANGIGDAFMTRPTLQAITKSYPGKFLLLTEEGAPSVLYEGLSFSRIVHVRVSNTGSGKRITTFPSNIPKCGLFLSLVPWFNKTLGTLVGYCSPTLTVGHFEYFNVIVPYTENRHAIDTTFQFATLLTGSAEVDGFLEAPELPCESYCFAGHIRALLPSHSSLVTMHFETAWSKRPPAIWAKQLVDICRARLTNSYFVIITKWEGFDELMGPRTLILRGASLYDAMAVVAGSDLFVGYDSCMLHVADLALVGGVAIFTAKTSPVEFGFRRSIANSISVTYEGDADDIYSKSTFQIDAYLQHVRMEKSL